MEKELRIADPKHEEKGIKDVCFLFRCTHLQGSALRFECQPLETQLQDVSEIFWFCPCLEDLRVHYDSRSKGLNFWESESVKGIN